MAQFELNTERLIISPLKIEDTNDLFNYRTNENVYKFQSWKPATLDEAKEFIENYSYNGNIKFKKWNQLGIYLRNGDKLIGDLGFCLNDPELAVIGFTVAKEYQNKGYAYEAMKKLLDFIISELKVKVILAQTDPQNAASIKLLKKLEFEKTGTVESSEHIDNEWKEDLVFVKKRRPPYRQP